MIFSVCHMTHAGHHLCYFGAHRSSASGDITYVICHVTSQDHVMPMELLAVYHHLDKFGDHRLGLPQSHQFWGKLVPTMVGNPYLVRGVIPFLFWINPHPPISKISPFLEIQDAPTSYRPIRKAKVL